MFEPIDAHLCMSNFGEPTQEHGRAPLLFYTSSVPVIHHKAHQFMHRHAIISFIFIYPLSKHIPLRNIYFSLKSIMFIGFFLNTDWKPCVLPFGYNNIAGTLQQQDSSLVIKTQLYHLASYKKD